MSIKVSNYPDYFGQLTDVANEVYNSSDIARKFEQTYGNVIVMGGVTRPLFTSDLKELENFVPANYFMIANDTTLLQSYNVNELDQNSEEYELFEHGTNLLKGIKIFKIEQLENENVTPITIGDLTVAYWYNLLNLLIIPYKFEYDLNQLTSSARQKITNGLIEILVRAHNIINIEQSILKTNNLFQKKGHKISRDLEAYKKILSDMSQESLVRELEYLKNQYETNKRNSEEHIRNFIALTKSNELNMAKIQGIESSKSELSNKAFNELELIASLPEVKDVFLDELKINILTNYIPIYSPELDTTFVGNCYYITVDLNSSRVKFESSIGFLRRGLWGNDPHPHVSGKSGEGCLGNIASTIAELSCAREYYALTTILVEYLKSVNIKDSAGAYAKTYPLDSKEIHEAYANLPLREFIQVLKSHNKFAEENKTYIHHCRHCGVGIDIDNDEYTYVDDDNRFCRECTEDGGIVEWDDDEDCWVIL